MTIIDMKLNFFLFDPTAFVKFYTGYYLTAAFSLERISSPSQTKQRASNFPQVQAKITEPEMSSLVVFVPEPWKRRRMYRDVCH